MVDLTQSERWIRDLYGVYLRSSSMSLEEYESLLAGALRGVRPQHPEFPVFDAFETETVMW